MPQVLTTASTLACGHLPKGGTLTPVTSTAKLKVSGNPVLQKANVEAALIPDCPIPQAAARCAKPLAVMVGPSLKLMCGGEPVLLDTLTGSTAAASGSPCGEFKAVTGGAPKLQVSR
ncbi:hypothetical protein ABZS86_04370 [Streptomyces sp. NPDC005355]|uniref:hypothetical protein n=1 Tax=Streptomyces sp. NPDC005355 TaxID=3157038 RepID=UPI0033A96846